MHHSILPSSRERREGGKANLHFLGSLFYSSSLFLRNEDSGVGPKRREEEELLLVWDPFLLIPPSSSCGKILYYYYYVARPS